MAGHKEPGSWRLGQHEMKESMVATMERENRKGKGDAGRKEEEGKNFGQQFCRIFLAPESGKRLRIPTSFNQYLQDQPTGLVCLKGPSGNTWLAELASDTEGLFFRHGWKEFVMDHFVEAGDILTFCYHGRSQFSVVVFDGMCIEKPSAFHAKPSKYLLGTNESDEDDKEMSAAPQEENNGTKKMTREIGTIESDEDDKEMSAAPQEDNNGTKKMTREIGTIESDEDDKEMSAAPQEDNNGTKKMTREIGTIESDEDDKEMSAAPQEDNNGTKKMTREIDANGSTMREPSNGASVDYKSATLNSSEDSDPSYLVSEESISRNESSNSVSRLLNFSKDVDIRGKTVAEFQRQPEVISQRPPVSEEQKNYVFQKAMQYKSKYPKTLQIMKETYVYRTFFMIIPCEFVRKHLPRADKKLTLWDPQGKAWEVTYVYCSKRSAGAFSGGWGKFSVGNHLEEFDVCVFELLSKDNIKVHIYRANFTLTPYLFANKQRSDSVLTYGSGGQ